MRAQYNTEAVLKEAVPAAKPDVAVQHTPLRLVIAGAFGGGNLGADGALAAMVAAIRRLRPDAQIYCLCEQPGPVSSAHAIAAAAMSWRSQRKWLGFLDAILLGLPRRAALLVHAVHRLRHADILIVPGTHLLDDYPQNARASRSALAAWLLLARSAKVRTALVSVGAGPWRSGRDRTLARTIAKLAWYRSYRDEASRQAVRAAGVDVRHDSVFPDLMFRGAEPRRTRPRPTQGTAITVGVDVVSAAAWRGDSAAYAAYCEKLSAFLHWLLDRGLTVRLLTSEAGDEASLHELARNIAARRFGQARERLHSQAASSLDALMCQIMETDIVVASHYHVAVGALRLGKPSVSLGLSEANAALFAELGFPDLNLSIDDFDTGALESLITRLVVDRTAYEAGIMEVRADLERRLGDQDARLAELLGPS